MVHGLFDWGEVYCEGVGMTEWRFGFFLSRFSCTGTVSTPGMCQTGATTKMLELLIAIPNP